MDVFKQQVVSYSSPVYNSITTTSTRLVLLLLIVVLVY